MNEIVLNRLREVCPSDNVDELTLSELIEASNIAFKIIGYNPENLEESVQRTYECSDETDLSDFIFEVWRIDRE